MATLTDEEQAQLDALTKKREQPDEETGRGSDRQHRVHYNIDFSDEAAVERAIKHGVLTRAEAEKEEEKQEEGETKDGAPRRRVTGADRWSK